MYNIEELRIRLLSELKEIAEELGVKSHKTLKKDDLVYAILDQQAITPEQALPKKKPSIVESSPEPEAEKPKPAEVKKQVVAAATSVQTEEPEYKPKFKRQNVTETPAAAPSEKSEAISEPAPKEAKEWKPKREPNQERPVRKASPEASTEEPKLFRPRKKAFEEESNPTPAPEASPESPNTQPEKEIELPKRRTYTSQDEIMAPAAEVTPHANRKKTYVHPWRI